MNKAPLRSLLTDTDVLRSLGLDDDFQRGIPDEGRETLEVLLDGDDRAIAPEQYTMLEAIVLLTGRPPLLVQDGKWTNVKSRAIRDRLEGARNNLERAIQRVGRVAILDHAMEYVGTGWMIDDDVLMTNRHVAELFAVARDRSFAFRTRPDGTPHRVEVDFRREHQRPTEWRADVREVLFVEANQDARPDMAFVRLARGADGLPAPLELADRSIAFQSDVASIGYPAKDSRNDSFAMQELFEGIYGVKRLSPGRVSGVRSDGMVIEHDCCTLGGSSGSPLIDLVTGKVCGLHFAGSYRVSNYAVTSTALKQRLQQLGPTIVAVPEGSVIAPPVAEAEARTRVEGLDARKGYDPSFLGEGELEVPLPELTEAQQEDLAAVSGREDGELAYTHFSLKMCASRRLAYFTAVNIDGNQLLNFPRGRDRWLAEPRLVDPAHQTEDGLYASNRLDRGHLVRRLDPVWGPRAEAARAMDDTFFFTNCSPQHERLNQQTWLSLEDYILASAANHGLKVSVFTGPVFGADDRNYRGVPIPEEFWKVVAMVNELTGRLSVSAYLLSQADELGELEFVFGEFRTYQVPVAEIEKKTGLSFGDLVDFDPLRFVESLPRIEIRESQDLVL